MELLLVPRATKDEAPSWTDALGNPVMLTLLVPLLAVVLVPVAVLIRRGQRRG